MNAVVTVVGKDMVGIIHKVSGKLLEHNLNILDINQSVVGDYFTMIMLIDITNIGENFEKL
ncbi:MAG: ACT domain-containing protein, partial [Peptoanaerobacter stomatis]